MRIYFRVYISLGRATNDLDVTSLWKYKQISATVTNENTRLWYIDARHYDQVIKRIEVIHIDEIRQRIYQYEF